MSYIITQKPSFMSDFMNLAKHQQHDVVKALDDLIQDAKDHRRKSIKKLDSYENVWRYRIGDFRLIYSVAGKVVQLLAVGARKDVYVRFGIDGDIPDAALIEEVERALDPTRTLSHEYVYVAPPAPTPISSNLPMILTEQQLRQWLIPDVFHAALSACQTEDDLMTAQVPPEHMERILNCLWPKAADQVAQEPNLILNDPEDLLRYAEGDLLGFLLKLDAEQEKTVDWALRGPTLIKGGPGSGKSTVALYRAAQLLSRTPSDTEKNSPTVLFTTYTMALARTSQHLLQRLSNGTLPTTLTVTHVDGLAMRIASQTFGNMPIADKREIQHAFTTAFNGFVPAAKNVLERTFIDTALANLNVEYVLEEFEWVIEGQRCIVYEDYRQADRSGRGYALNEVLRRAVWELYERFRANLKNIGKHTFSQVRLAAFEAVKTGRWAQRFDYVLIDEAQDLSPCAIALCVELCVSPEGLFLTADSNQSLYNKGFRWKKVHEDLRVTGRTRLLNRNYRSTAEIALAARELVADDQVADSEALNQDFVHHGALPRIATFNTDDEQIKWLIDQIYLSARELRLPLGAAAILIPHNSLAEKITEIATRLKFPVRYMASREIDVRCPEVKVITMHAAKGLEFPIVAIPFLAEGQLPNHFQSSDEALMSEHLNAARRLLFVACTRAMRQLLITYPTVNPSRFIQLLSAERWQR